MEILYTNCAGLDVHKKTVKVCMLTQTSNGQPRKEFRTYFTTTEELLKLCDWLKEQGCRHVAEDRNRGVPAPHNVAKKILEWEYVRKILRVHLRTRLVDEYQARPDCTLSSHEGSFPQGPGASHAQNVPFEQQVPGGVRHV